MNDDKVDLWRHVALQRQHVKLLDRLEEMNRKLERAQWHLNAARLCLDDEVDDLKSRSDK